MSNKNNFSSGVLIAALIPTIIMGFIYIVGLFLAIPCAFTFVSEMNAPPIITFFGYLALIAMIIIGTLAYLGIVIKVTINNFENL
jgi:hypothetical protein